MPGAADSASRTSDAAPNLANPRFLLTDSLRGLAAFSVFGAHVTLYLTATAGETLNPVLARLDVGIAIFLVLSAFLLYRPFAQARFTATTRPGIVPYAVRRALRVVPAYWVALPIIALWLGLGYVFTLDGVLTYFPFLQVYDPHTIARGIGQAWTVCVEITFYAMLPVWAVAVGRLRFRSDRGFIASEFVPLAVIFGFSVVWKLVFFSPSPAVFGASNTVGFEVALYTLPAYLDSFAVGMGLAVVSVVLGGRERQPRAVRLIDRSPWIPVAFAAVAYWLSGLGVGAYSTDSTGFVLHQLLNTLVALALFLPVVFGDETRGLVRRFLRWKWLLWLGGITYGFYLWHLAVLRALAEAGLLATSTGRVVFVLGGFVLSVVAGAISYYGLERYALRLGRRIPRAGLRGGRRRSESARDPREVPGEAGRPEMVRSGGSR